MRPLGATWNDHPCGNPSPVTVLVEAASESRRELLDDGVSVWGESVWLCDWKTEIRQMIFKQNFSKPEWSYLLGFD